MANGTRPNMAPADEMELVRAELKRLRAREAALREQVLEQSAAGARPEPGQDWRVEVVEQRRRTLDRKALPAEISEDPRFWRETTTRVVKTVSVRAPLATKAKAGSASLGLLR